jgi:hypothetical protein
MGALLNIAGKIAVGGAKVARVGLRVGVKVLKNTVANALADMHWAKGSSTPPSTGVAGPGVAGNDPTKSVSTGVSSQTDQRGSVKQSSGGSTLSAVSKSVDEVAKSVTNIRSATEQTKARLIDGNQVNPAEALQPVEDAIDKTDNTVEQLRKVASTPLVESKQIAEIAQAATGINRSVTAEQKAQAKQAQAQTLASERVKPITEPVAAPVEGAPQDTDALQPVQTALTEFSKAIEELTEQIKSKGGAGPTDQGSTWIDSIKNAVGWVKNTGGLAKDAAGLAKSKVVTPIANLGGKVGNFLSKMFGRTGNKLTGSVGERVGQLLESRAGNILGKSVAGAGLVLGSIDAIEHAVKGDWVGVGLDAAVVGGSTAELTGVGAAPGAAVAAIAAATGVIRDGYADIFGVPPEQDPSFKDNMNMVTQFAVNWVKSKLGMEAKKEQKKTAQQIQSAAPTAASVTPPKTQAPPPAPPQQPTPPKSAAPPASKPVAAPARKPSPGATHRTNAPTEHGSSSTSSAAGPGASQNDAAATMTPPTTGTTLAAASTTVDNMAAQPTDTSSDAIDSMLGRPQLRPMNYTGRQRTGLGVTHSPFFPLDMETASREFLFDPMEMGR